MRLEFPRPRRLGKAEMKAGGGGLICENTLAVEGRKMVLGLCWVSGALHCCLSLFFSFCNIDNINVTLEIFLNSCCNG